MNTPELRDLLESEISGFPDRASGEEGYRFVVRITRPYVESERKALTGVLEEWMQLRAEPKTMLAVKLAVDFRLGELREAISNLLDDVEAGEVFNPALRDYYRKRITEALNSIQ